MYNFYFKYKNPESTNLVDPLKIIQGKGISQTGRSITTLSYAVSDYIPVEPGVTYQGHSQRDDTPGEGSFSYVTFYDLDKIRVPNSGLSDGLGDNTSYFTIPEGVFFIRVTFPGEYDGQDPNQVGLTVGQGSAFTYFYRSRKVKPIYQKMDREFALEGDNRYYREKLKGTFKVVRNDYKFLDAAAFDDKITLVVEDQDGVLDNYYGYFYKTDCSWNADDEIVEIKKVEPEDDYESVLGGLDKSFNLVQLAPELAKLTLARRSIIQVYVGGNTKLSSFLGGTSWEEDLVIDPTEDDALLENTYHFKKWHDEMLISPNYFSSGQISEDVTGRYVQAVREDGAYYLNSKVNQGSVYSLVYYEIERASDQVVVYRSDYFYGYPYMNEVVFHGELGDAGATGSVRFTTLEIYIRILCGFAEEDYNFPLPEEDIIARKNGYNWAAPSGYDTVHWSSELQEQPTEWGQAPSDTPGAGLYYVRPMPSPFLTGLSAAHPVAPSNWTDYSIWLYYSDFWHLNQSYRYGTYDIRDCYALHSVINVLLRAIDSPIRHFKSPEYSELLYAAECPLGAYSVLPFEIPAEWDDVQNFGNIDLYYTPKSNAIKGDYDRAASKAEITLHEVLNTLRDTFRIYWHIEDGRLRLEHISWYQNGGSYDAPVVGTDLTNLLNLRTNLDWSFGQNSWDFDKEKMPERFEFDWMDDVSPVFDGHPIQVRSNYVQKGQIENRSAGRVTTDIDFMGANPQDISKDGFCLLGAVEYQGQLRVPMVRNDIGYSQVTVAQNALLSYFNLHPRFHVNDLPADKVTVNNEDVTLADNNTKQKKQEIRYPGKVDDGSVTGLDPYKLVKTDLGNGLIEKLSINMESLTLAATIKHDTE